MAEKTIKLSGPQLETLKNLANPEYKHTYWQFREHSYVRQYFAPSLKALKKHDLVRFENRVFMGRVTEDCPEHVFITDKGIAHLDSLGIAPVELAPPPKTDAARIAELEAALQKTLNDIGYYFALEDVILTQARDVLADIQGYCQQALGIEE